MTVEQYKRVLVVDDDVEIRELLVATLRLRGLVVDEAPGGREALDLIREHRYAVVLLDLFMPVVDGFAVLRALDGDDIQSRPVVLVVTGADKGSIDRLDAGQIHGIVRKPFDPEELGALVLACSEIKSRGTFGTMAIATMISGSQLLHWLVNK